MRRAQQAPRQITLLRDSKSRFGIMIDVETSGFVIKRIAPTDALPPAGKFVFDERDKLSVGDLVLSVGATPLVDEHGLLLLDLDGARSLIKDVQGDSIVLMVKPYNRAAAAAEKAAAARMEARRASAEQVAAAAAEKAAAKQAAAERAAEQQAAADNAVAEKWAAERAAAQKAAAEKVAAEEAVAAAIAAERAAAQKKAAERLAEDKAEAQKAERARAAAAAERAAERAATERAVAAAAAVAERAKAQKVAAEKEAAAKALAEGRAAAVQKAAAAAAAAAFQVAPSAEVARLMPRDRAAALELDTHAQQAAGPARSPRRTFSKKRAQVALAGKNAVQVTLVRDSKSQFGFAIGAGAAGIVVTGIAPNHALPLADRAFDERDKMCLGDVVLNVGGVPLVNERGQRLAGIDVDHVRSLVKNSPGDSIVLTVQRDARRGSPDPDPEPDPDPGPDSDSDPHQVQRDARRRSRGKEYKTQQRSSWFARWLPGGMFNAGTPFERALRTIVIEPFAIALRVKLTDAELVTNGLNIRGNTVEIRARPEAGGTFDQHWCQVAASLPVSARALGLPSGGRVDVEVHVTLMSPLGLSEAQKTVQLAADLLESSWPEGDAAGSPAARELATERLQRARRARRTRNARGSSDRQSISAVTIEAVAAQMQWLHKRTSEITGVAIPSFALPATASALPQDGTAVQLGDTRVSRL